MENTIKKPAVRQGNFELLRIVAMVMIVTLHYLGYEKLLEVNDKSTTYYVSWVLEALSFVAVNIYVLISGYFIKSTKFRLNKILDLWIQTIVIASGGYIVARITGIADPTDKELLFKSINPVTRNTYWFITAYFIFCAVAPFLAYVANYINQRQHKILCATLVFITSVIPTVFYPVDWLKITKGYHIVWFITLYFVASYIRKYDSFKRSPFVYFIGYVLSIGIGLAIKFVIKYCYELAGVKEMSDTYFKRYNMFFIFAASVFLFLAFKNIHIKSDTVNRIILFFSSATLYVYLFHEIPSIKYYMWSDIVNPMGHLGVPTIIINYVLGIGGVYLTCTLLGTIFKTLYNLLQLPKLTLKISEGAEKLAKGFMNSKLISKH